MKDAYSSNRLSHNSEMRRLMCQFAVIGPLAVAATAFVGQQAAIAEASKLRLSDAEIAMSVDLSEAPEAVNFDYTPFPFDQQNEQNWTVSQPDAQIIQTTTRAVDPENEIFLAQIFNNSEVVPPKPENEIWAENIQKLLKDKLGITVDELTIDKVFLERMTPSNLETVLNAIVTMFNEIDSPVECFKTHIPKLSFEPTPNGIKGARTGHFYDPEGKLIAIRVQFPDNALFEYNGTKDPTGGVGFYGDELVHALATDVVGGHLYGQGPYRGDNVLFETASNIGHDLLDVEAQGLGLPAGEYDVETERAATAQYANTGIFTEVTGTTLPPGIPSFVIGSLDNLHNLPLSMFNVLTEAIAMRLSYELVQAGVPLREVLETLTHLRNKEYEMLSEKVISVLDVFVDGELIANDTTETFPQNDPQQIALVRRRPPGWILRSPSGTEVVGKFEVDIATLKLVGDTMYIGTGIGLSTVLGEWVDPNDSSHIVRGGIKPTLWLYKIPVYTLYNHKLIFDPTFIGEDGETYSLDDPNVTVKLTTIVDGKEITNKFDFAQGPDFDPDARPPTPMIN